MVRCESKNTHQRDIICLNEIELCAQDLITIIDLKVKISDESIAFYLGSYCKSCPYEKEFKQQSY